ncbi:MAG: HAD family phosphatase [Anaerolineae bacterium]|nr:HAD family phosphatase [Anaerolineae bacterium]
MSQNPIRFIYFDLGGVVLNFSGGFVRLAAAFGRPQPAIEQAYFRHAAPAARGTISTAEFWNRIRQDLNLRQDEAVFDYEGCWTDGFVPIPQIHQLMRELAACYSIGILSNTEFGVYEYAVQKGSIPADVDFAVVIKSCEVGAVKPEQAIYRIAEQRAGVSGGAILFIDDRSDNVHAAQALGWRGVVFDTAHPEQSIRAIKAALEG